MHEKEGEINILDEEKMILRPKIEWGGSLECLRDVLGGKEAERIERNESEIARRLYIESS